MLAIYKREVKAYLTSMLGYVFIALNLLLVGIYFTFYNLQYGYPYLDYTLSGVSFVFLVTTPILTMKVMADERRQKTDQLLLTAPITPGTIVAGKYLALVTIFLIPMAIICCYPLLLSSFGEVSLKMAYTALLGYFLSGCAYLALGMFLSSITESPVLAAVITFGACFSVLYGKFAVILYFGHNLCHLRGSDRGGGAGLPSDLFHDKELSDRGACVSSGGSGAYSLLFCGFFLDGRRHSEDHRSL